jgi:hypothetical protein
LYHTVDINVKYRINSEPGDDGPPSGVGSKKTAAARIQTKKENCMGNRDARGREKKKPKKKDIKEIARPGRSWTENRPVAPPPPTPPVGEKS